MAIRSLCLGRCITTPCRDYYGRIYCRNAMAEQKKSARHYGGQAEGLHPFLKFVEACNKGNEKRSEFLSFIVEDNVVGYIHPSFAKYLCTFPKVFVREISCKQKNDQTITLHRGLKSAEERTVAVGVVLEELKNDGLIPGWRDEQYPVVTSFDSPPYFSLERAAAPYFGIKAFGVHMNGYTDSCGTKCLWVARRSLTKQTYPGCLDHLVAGGQPIGLVCFENIVKECEEEAGIPKTIAQLAVPVGAVSYENIEGETYKRDTLFCYDLKLPSDFAPFNRDGEVENFYLHSIPKVIDSLENYKPNCALVVIDFLFRHGYLKPDQRGYLQLLHGLRQERCL